MIAVTRSTIAHAPAPAPERVIALYVPAHEQQSNMPPVDHRAWEQVFRAVQNAVPGAAQQQPGWCVMRARGPTRYYGSEHNAAMAVLACLSDTRGSVGVADGRFAAQQAAKVAAHAAVHIIQPGETPAFLASLPIAHIGDDPLSEMLSNLGVHTLGAFATLPESAVLQRFGREAVHAHRRARGLGEPHRTEVVAATTPHNFTLQFEFEPPLTAVDQLAFASATHAEQFVRKLNERGLVCTELQVTLRDDAGEWKDRRWSHPANFTPTDVVNRIRWQATELTAELTADAESLSEHTGAGITAVRISPVHTAQASGHEPGLWNSAPDDRVHHQLTRAQSIVGHASLGTALLLGGRLSADRQALLPWGTAAEAVLARMRPRAGPWPGSMQGAAPNTVFARPPAVSLLGASGSEITIDADDLLSEPPTRFSADTASRHQVLAWSAPWPVRERWWRHDSLTVFRLQIALEASDAWLLFYAPGTGWFAEGRYR